MPADSYSVGVLGSLDPSVLKVPALRFEPVCISYYIRMKLVL